MVRENSFFASMPRGLTEKGDMIRAFARWKGCTVRTARLYRKDPGTGRPRPEWVEWLRSREDQGAAVKDGAAVPVVNGVSEWERAAAARDAAWDTLRRLQARVMEVGPEEMPAVARAVREQRRAWADACRHAQDAELAAGRLIPREKLEHIERDLVGPLNDAFRSMRNNVAGLMPKNMRAHFYNAWKGALPGWERAVGAIDMEFEKMLRS